ncbi:MAG: ABC transporter ATP-binding protein [Weeksellaceae bacterium]
MNRLKDLIKKHFSSFAFFYHYLGSKVFIAFFLSVAVSFLDGLGLTMFFPLLQVVGVEAVGSESSDLGNLTYLMDGIESLGISLTLGSVLIIMLVFFTFKGVAFYFSYVYRIILQQSFIRKLRVNLLDGLNRMSFKRFILSDAGRIQNTLSGEVNSVSTSFNAYFASFEQVIMLVVYIGFAFFLDAKFALLVCLGGGLTHFLYKIIYKKTTVASYSLTEYNNVFQGQIIQHVGNFKYLKASGRVNTYGDRLKETVSNIEESRKRMGVLSSIGGAAREPLMVGIIVLVIFIQIKFLEGNLGTMLISLMFFYRGLSALVSLQQSWNSYLGVSGSMANMQSFLQLLKETREEDGTIKVDQFKEKISLEKVGFSYGETKILKNIHLDISKNESIAFVGESGSGKTTLVNLLAALLPESEGEIKVDGIPIKQLHKESYQKRIGYVSQDAVIFNDTIFNNVTFWAKPTPENWERFTQSIEKASLKEFLSELPEGAETLLGNNGINLSGGQKQRISIARELYKDIDILILDEATSALDSETEKVIQDSIESLQGNFTLLIVAHRLSTIRNVDRVVLMDKGEIVDMDSFDKLIQKQDRFRRMVELQEL